MSSERKILKATRRKKQDYINSLPEEVLCMIFDRLDLYEVKRASESCQRWHSIIFLSGYVNRFVLNIYLNYCYHNTAAHQIQKFKAVVANSQRCYRNLRWFGANNWEDSEFSSVWETIHPEVTKHLHSISIQYVNSSKMLPLIADALPLMSVLRSLTLIDNKRNCDTQDVIPTLRSDSLKRLNIESIVKYRLDMPQLQSFNGRLSAFHLPDDSREAVALSSLKDLHVYRDVKEDTSKHRIPMLRTLFHQTRLEKSRWDALDSEIFTLICETCTTLKELHLQYYDENDLNSLAKLTNLRILVIYFCSRDIDLSKLNQLEEVQLVCVENVVKLPTSIRKLELLISTDNEQNMSQTILSSSTQLTELLVDIEEEDKWLKYDAPSDILKALPHLNHLKVLKFSRGRFKKSSFLCMDAPLETLQQLHFEESNVSSKHFLGLQEKFPNLKKLSFSKCGCWKEVYDTDSLSMSFADSDESYESPSNSTSDTESDEDD